MDTPLRLTTFAELEQQSLELRVTCQRCGHVAIVDPGSPALRHRKLAGQRFRCSLALPTGQKCSGVGLPEIEPAGSGATGFSAARRWPTLLERHAGNLRDRR